MLKKWSSKILNWDILARFGCFRNHKVSNNSDADVMVRWTNDTSYFEQMKCLLIHPYLHHSLGYEKHKLFDVTF